MWNHKRLLLWVNIVTIFKILCILTCSWVLYTPNIEESEKRSEFHCSLHKNAKQVSICLNFSFNQLSGAPSTQKLVKIHNIGGNLCNRWGSKVNTFLPLPFTWKTWKEVNVLFLNFEQKNCKTTFKKRKLSYASKHHYCGNFEIWETEKVIPIIAARKNLFCPPQVYFCPILKAIP